MLDEFLGGAREKWGVLFGPRGGEMACHLGG